MNDRSPTTADQANNSLDVRALLRRADAHLQAGRYADARATYAAALDRDPQWPDAWFNLAWLERADRQFERALAAYERALQTGLTTPAAALVNRAAILSEHLNRPSEAEAELQRALALAPDFIPALLNLGSLHEDFGNPLKAANAYQAVLRLDPVNGRALARNAAIATLSGEIDDVVRRLEQGLNDSRDRPVDRAEILFALGHAEDTRGNYSSAFTRISEANELGRRLAGPTGRFDRDAHSALIDAIITAYPVGHYPSASFESETPVFICGMFRSGSTLCEQLVTRHADIAAGGELDMIPAMVVHELAPFPETAMQLTSSDLDRLRKDYERGVALRGLPRPHTDKRPDNFLYLGLIKSLYPAARILNTVRNPADTLLSIYFAYLDDSVGYSFDLIDIVHYIKEYNRLVDHWRMAFGADIHDFSYEAAVHSPDHTVAEAAKFCGIRRRSNNSKNAINTSELVRTPSAWQVRQPVHSRSVGRSRHYAQQLACFAAQL